MWSDTKYGDDLPYCGNYVRSAQLGGWYTIIWNLEVQARLDALYTALGTQFNGEAYFEGTSLTETAQAKPIGDQFGYSSSGKLAGFKAKALSAKTAFPDKAVIQMINYASFDLPTFAAWCTSYGIGIGGPDVVINNKNDSIYTDIYPLYKKYRNVTLNGPDVQWDCYEKINPKTGKYYTVQELLDASIEIMDPWYMFWSNRAPYFSRDVVPAIRKFHDEGHSLGHK